MVKAKPSPPNKSQTSREQVLNGDLFGDSEPSPQADVESFDNKKLMGRLRKYEIVGLRGDISVRDIVRFRYSNNRYIEGMSQDMQNKYNYWYFTRPIKLKDGDKYERHVRSWNRRKKWLAEIRAIGSVGDSSIGDLP
jgi:hypothetical protein